MADTWTVSSSSSHTCPPDCPCTSLDGYLWPGHQGCSLEFCQALCTAISDSAFPSCLCVCACVCVHSCACVCALFIHLCCPLLTNSFLTRPPPAPDEQFIWNVTVLPNSKWANITWKHNFGPGTDFVVEYIDSKHCCAGWWWWRGVVDATTGILCRILREAF